MNAKVVAQESDGGIWRIEVDTNRIVSSYGHDNSFHNTIVTLGMFLNIIHAALTIKAMDQEIEEEKILKAMIKKE